MAKAKKSSPAKIVGAFLFLGAAAWVAFQGILGGSKPVTPTPGSGEEVTGAGVGDAEAVPEAVLRVDLLAEHGSYVEGTHFKSPFVPVAKAATSRPARQMPAAPGGPGGAISEAGDAREARARSQDEVSVTMIFRTGRIRRAVVQGRVVGVDDVVDGLRIVEIQDDAIVVLNAGRRERYTLADQRARDSEVDR